jgi:hypothetical protein
MKNIKYTFTKNDILIIILFIYSIVLLNNSLLIKLKEKNEILNNIIVKEQIISKEKESLNKISIFHNELIEKKDKLSSLLINLKKTMNSKQLNNEMKYLKEFYLISNIYNNDSLKSIKLIIESYNSNINNNIITKDLKMFNHLIKYVNSDILYIHQNISKNQKEISNILK